MGACHFGGGFLIGAGQLVGMIWVAVLISTWEVALFWKLLGLPIGILSLLASWQMFLLHRLLSMSIRTTQPSIVSEISDRARLALIFTGVMMLLLIFLTAGEIFWSAAIFG